MYFTTNLIKKGEFQGWASIRLKEDPLQNGLTETEVQILVARLLGLKYNEWLDVAEESLGAIITSDEFDFVYPIFPKDKLFTMLLHLLNLRYEYVIKKLEGSE